MRALVLTLVFLGVTQFIAPDAASTQKPILDPQLVAKREEAGRLSAQVIELYRQGKFDEALPIAVRVLELSESAFGPGDVAVADASSTLAELYVAKRKYEVAGPLYLRAIDINDKVLRPGDSVQVTTLERYACLLNGLGQDDKLKEFDKQRLPVLRSSSEPDRFWGALWTATEVIRLPRPDYPAAARGAMVSGRILIEITLDEEGKAVRARSMCGGSPLLIEAAEGSARKAQYKPIVVAGKPIRIIGYQLYRFVRGG